MAGKRGAPPLATAYSTADSTTVMLAGEAKAMYIENSKDVQQGFAMPTTTSPLRLSQFRANLFQVADAALQSGEPVPLERNGRRLWLVPEGSGSRLGKLPRRAVIVGDPDELVHLNAAEWNEDSNLG